MYQVVYSRQARKDALKLSRSNLKRQAQEILEILARDPFQTPPRYESLVGELAGCTPGASTFSTASLTRFSRIREKS